MRGVFRFPLPILEICHISFELVANFEVTYLDVVQGDIPERSDISSCTGFKSFSLRVAFPVDE